MHKIQPETPHNPTEKYVGSYYAIHGTGGFSIHQPVNKIQIQTISNIGKHDVTDCIQIRLPANVLNENIQNDEVRLTTELLLANISPDSILSIGKYENLYEKYMQYVNLSVGHIFQSTLLNEASHEIYKRGFTKQTLIDLLTVPSATNDTSIGEWRIFDIEKTVNHLQTLNVFGNRNVNDVNNVNNANNVKSTKEHKFLPGDMIFINAGFSISLSVNAFTEGLYSAMMGKDLIDNDIFAQTYECDVLLYLD